MDQAFKYLSDLSPWVAVPIILVTVFVTLWPKVYQVIMDLSADNRRFQNEKQRLELLKLRYEIEAIRKSNGLDQIAADVVPPPLAQAPAIETPLGTGERLSVWKRFGYGAMGGLAPGLYRLLVTLIGIGHSLPGSTPAVEIAATVFALVIMSAFGGVAASFVPRSRASPTLCAMIGVSTVLVLLLGTQPQAPATMPPPSPVA